MKLFSVKPASTAYTGSMLPQNRKEVFWDVLRLHLGKFFWLGLLMLLCTLPVHLSAILCDVYIVNTDPALSKESILQFQNLQSLISIPLMTVLALPLAGLLRLLRQYAWGENVTFSFDFFKGLKQNWIQTALTVFVGSSSFSMALISFRTASGAESNAAIFALIPLGLFLLLIFPLCALMMAAIPVYSNSWIGNFKVALMIYAKAPVKILAALFGMCALWILSFIPIFYFQIFGRIIAGLLTPVSLFAWMLFCYSQFDRYININEHPDLINKGILGIQYSDRHAD